VRGVNRNRLKELEGFRVAELPWFTMEPASFRNLDNAFDLAESPFAALYALGVDAFRLAERAPLIVGGAFTELLGSTGELEFGTDGRIQRRLARTVLHGGNLTSAHPGLGR
jgi:outer membrane PBP1 activator LpoA protein